MSPPGATRLALALAFTACGLSAWAVLRPLPEPPPCTCAEAAPARVIRPEPPAERAPLPPLPPLADAPEPRVAGRPAPPSTEAPPDQPKAPEPPKYVRFREVPPSLRVEPSAGDSISVTNTDPAATGKLFVLQAETEDGEVVRVTVVAPPPP